MGAKIRSLKNVSLSYNSVDFTEYLNQASLQNTVEAIDTTTFDSDGKENAAGASSFSISVGGPWSKAVDDVLGVDGASPPTTLRTLVYSVGPSGGQVIRTWTGSATVGSFISDYQIDASNPLGLVMWTGTLTISGTPVRTTA